MVLCPRHKVEMRPVQNERGQMIESCYLCEREEKPKEDLIILEKLRKQDREED
jgi:hypothetical protein